MKRMILLALALTMLASPASAAYALIANVGAGSTTGDNVTTGAITTTGADLCVANVASTDIGIVTVTDSKSNTWTELTLQDNTLRDRLVYSSVTSVGASHTFTASSTGGLPSIQVACFSGSKLTSPFDQQNGVNTGTDPTAQPGSITPTENNELVASGTSWNGAGETASINGCYASTDQHDAVAAQHRGGALAYCIQTTATATNPTWTYTGPGTSVLVTIASFKAAAAAGGTRRGMLLGVGP